MGLDAMIRVLIVLIWLVVGLFALTGHARRPQQAAPPNAVKHVHDPCLVRDGRYYYLFSTGPGVLVRRSANLARWEFVGRVFPDDVPDWANKEIPGARSLWAPYVAYFEGRFHLYYTVSQFGRNRSIIGLATNRSLEPGRKDYKWQDQGKVVESQTTDNFNAIDPSIAFGERGRVALLFGSFWSGIKMLDLDPATGKPAAGAQIRSIASRPFPGAIEAGTIVRHGPYYYLLVSFDYCCRGVNSTYNIRVGRSRRLEGPYADRDGKPMLEGGGTLLLGTEGSAIGPGHCSVLRERSGDRLAYHFYDGADNGIPTLQIRPIRWESTGWPSLGAPLAAPGG